MKTYKIISWIILILFFIVPFWSIGQTKNLVFDSSKIERKSMKMYFITTKLENLIADGKEVDTKRMILTK